jgi:hypothetical protein
MGWAGWNGSWATSRRHRRSSPLSICLNVDSFEHLEFETRPDQLLTYRLVQGDEAIVIDFAPTGSPAGDAIEPRQLAFDVDGYVQMELLTPEENGDEQGSAS